MPALIDSTYTGARWTYGLRFRPVSIAGLPKGWIVNSNRPLSGFQFGTIDYPNPVPREDIESYQLVFLYSCEAQKSGKACAKGPVRFYDFTPLCNDDTKRGKDCFRFMCGTRMEQQFSTWRELNMYNAITGLTPKERDRMLELLSAFTEAGRKNREAHT